MPPISFGASLEFKNVWYGQWMLIRQDFWRVGQFTITEDCLGRNSILRRVTEFDNATQKMGTPQLCVLWRAHPTSDPTRANFRPAQMVELEHKDLELRCYCIVLHRSDTAWQWLIDTETELRVYQLFDHKFRKCVGFIKHRSLSDLVSVKQ